MEILVTGAAPGRPWPYGRPQQVPRPDARSCAGARQGGVSSPARTPGGERAARAGRGTSSWPTSATVQGADEDAPIWLGESRRAAALARDGFTYQHCGAQGPEIVAHLWHQPCLLPSRRPEHFTSLCSACRGTRLSGK
jgi:hypothetical protein